MYVLVIGCGRTGSSIASLLSKQGEDVVVVDRNKSSFRKLSAKFTGFTVLGDATEIEVLEESKLDKTDLVVVTTDDDNVNAMVAQIASEIYEVEKVVVRIIDPEKKVIYKDLDVMTMSPTSLLVDNLIGQIGNWSKE
ncbi:potassium channel family protein [Halanaerobacter jeridensis]|uniref:Trk system potassium uptake protein TrkA n=1 Tax=Halanaerobacter jeridensis TaxID=706427 RepID=A0A939BNS8_9FIRM|nr:TrkA family potassium uptake protein [Halanaerobacter jeridensis]MBM7555758.1 trk system potassium uptake protein TrkA [Halanaerobacter jeridensis]